VNTAKENPVAIKIHSPEGRTAAAPHALTALPDVLAGLRVAVLDNGKPNAALLLTTLADGLAARAGTRVSLVVGKETAATPADPGLLDEIRAAADLVLTGSAD
jgi:hypothetical protein